MTAPPPYRQDQPDPTDCYDSPEGDSGCPTEPTQVHVPIQVPDAIVDALIDHIRERRAAGVYDENAEVATSRHPTDLDGLEVYRLVQEYIQVILEFKTVDGEPLAEVVLNEVDEQ